MVFFPDFSPARDHPPVCRLHGWRIALKLLRVSLVVSSRGDSLAVLGACQRSGSRAPRGRMHRKGECPAGGSCASEVLRSGPRVHCRPGPPSVGGVVHPPQMKGAGKRLVRCKGTRTTMCTPGGIDRTDRAPASGSAVLGSACPDRGLRGQILARFLTFPLLYCIMILIRCTPQPILPTRAGEEFQSQEFCLDQAGELHAPGQNKCTKSACITYTTLTARRRA